jgi:ABC-type branched-subunit amino acid transport system substrate-binding protein
MGEFMKLLTLITTALLLSGCIFQKSADKPAASLHYNLLVMGDSPNQSDLMLGVKSVEYLINSGGGFSDGRTLKVDFVEHGKDSSETVNILKNELHNSENVIGVITSWSTRSKHLVRGYSASNKIPVIGAVTTADYLSGISPWFHRISPPDSLQVKALAEYNKDSLGVQSVTIVLEDGDIYTQGLVDQFQTYFSPDKIDTIITLTSVASTSDTSLLRALLNTNSDVIFLAILDFNLYTNLMRNLHGANNDQKSLRFIATDAIVIESISGSVPLSFIGGTDQDQNPKWVQSTFSADFSSQQYLNYIQALRNASFYNQAHEALTNPIHPFYHDAAMLFALALEQTLSKEGAQEDYILREKINERIRPISNPSTGSSAVTSALDWNQIKTKIAQGAIHYEGITGNCNIDDQGNAYSGFYIKTLKEQDAGAYEIENSTYIVFERSEL